MVAGANRVVGVSYQHEGNPMSSLAGSHIKDYYEKYWVEVGSYSRSLGPRVLHFLAAYLRPDRRILEVGCGTGRAAGQWIHRRAGDYTGVDISDSAVTEARSLGLNVRTIEDASRLPFKDASFALVLCLEVLEHLFQPQSAVQEILRVLQPGGVLIASVPNLTHWRHRLLFLTGRWDPAGDSLSRGQPWRDPHLRFFTATILSRMLDESGFVDIRVLGEEPVRVRQFPFVGKFLANPRHARLCPVAFSHNLVAVGSKPSQTEITK